MDILSPHTGVLIIDDDRHYCFILEKMLTALYNYGSVTSYINPEQGFMELFRNTSKYQLAFVDYNFPAEITGGDILQKIQEHQLSRNCVVFLVTAEPTRQRVIQALSYGAAGVIAKPFAKEELLIQLRSAQDKIIEKGRN